MATAEQIAECFEIFDRDNDGKIAKSELPTLIRALGKNPTNEDMHAVLSGVPDSLDLAGLTALLAKDMPTPESQAESITNAFKSLDIDNTGKIDARQLRQILASLGDALSPEEIESLFNEVKVDGDNGLDYAAFVDVLVNSYSLKTRPPPFDEKNYPIGGPDP